VSSAQYAFNVLDEIGFNEGLRHREYQCDVRRNQINLGVILSSEAIDSLDINVRIVNQREGHSDESLNTVAAILSIIPLIRGASRRSVIFPTGVGQWRARVDD